MKTRCLTAAVQALGSLSPPPSLHAPLTPELLSLSALSTCRGPGPLCTCCSLCLECLSPQKAQTEREPASERGGCALTLGSFPPHTWSRFPELADMTHFSLPEASWKQSCGSCSFVWLWCPEGRLETVRRKGGLAGSSHPPPSGNGAWLPTPRARCPAGAQYTLRADVVGPPGCMWG